MLGVFRSAVLMTIIFLAQVQSRDPDIELLYDMEEDTERCCGLKGDKTLWSQCLDNGRKDELIPSNVNYIQYGNDCSKKGKNDYRCYKACHWGKIGVLDSKTGQIHPDKYFTHLDHLFEGMDLSLNKTMVEKIKNNSKGCFLVDGKNVTMSLTKCEQNEPIIQCLLDGYKEICRPGAVVKVLKKWHKKGKKCLFD